MLLISLLLIWLNKVNIVVTWWNHFNKELITTKEDHENFESSKKQWIRDNTFAEGDVKVRDHRQITGKYRGTAHRL